MISDDKKSKTSPAPKDEAMVKKEDPAKKKDKSQPKDKSASSEEARSTQSGRAHYKKRLRFTGVVDRLGKKMRRSGGGGLGSPGTGNY
jgi:hypothetical protein